MFCANIRVQDQFNCSKLLFFILYTPFLIFLSSRVALNLFFYFNSNDSFMHLGRQCRCKRIAVFAGNNLSSVCLPTDSLFFLPINAYLTLLLLLLLLLLLSYYYYANSIHKSWSHFFVFFCIFNLYSYSFNFLQPIQLLSRSFSFFVFFVCFFLLASKSIYLSKR